MTDLTINAFYGAIIDLEREAQFRWNVGGSSNIDRYRDLQRTIRDAHREYDALSAALPRMRELKAAADRSYDAFVTRLPEERGCTCHINPPCSHCTSQADEETDD